MRRYETIVVSHPDLSEEDLETLTQRNTDLIKKSQGEMIQVQQWGKKKLAYRVKKQSRGYYTLLDYASLPEAVVELERALRLDDKIMKYLTVKLDDKVDLETVREAIKVEQKAAPVQEIEVDESPPAEEVKEEIAEDVETQEAPEDVEEEAPEAVQEVAPEDVQEEAPEAVQEEAPEAVQKDVSGDLQKKPRRKR